MPEDLRVDEEDVRHRQERRNGAAQLTGSIGAARRQVEPTIEGRHAPDMIIRTVGESNSTLVMNVER